MRHANCHEMNLKKTRRWSLFVTSVSRATKQSIQAKCPECAQYRFKIWINFFSPQFLLRPIRVIHSVYLQIFWYCFRSVLSVPSALAIRSIRVDTERLPEWIFIDATVGAAVATKSQFTCVQCVSRKQVTQLPIYMYDCGEWLLLESVCLAFLVAGVRL